MKLYTKDQIEAAIDVPLLMQEIEKGLIDLSEGKVNTSPIGFLQFNSPPGDVHIKSCALLNDEWYVVKIASGFYDNPQWGLSSSQGLMLLFSQKTGALQAILLDEGRLTDLRTALAGAICCKYLAPKTIECMGIIGTGIQAKQQLLNLQYVTSCRNVMVWGRSQAKSQAFADDPELASFAIQSTKHIEEITQKCRLIVTTTASHEPLLFGHQLVPGTHITAVGADSPEKQELDASIFDVADLIVVDSLSQCLEFGDLSHARHVIEDKPVMELGAFLKKPLEREDQWITVADLTGVAIEDLQVAKTIFAQLLSFEKV
jgi:ornithine cyclodeaminase